MFEKTDKEVKKLKGMSDFYVQRCQQLEFANLQLQEEKRSLTAQLHEKRNVENKLRQCQVQNTELQRRLRELGDYRNAQGKGKKVWHDINIGDGCCSMMFVGYELVCYIHDCYRYAGFRLSGKEFYISTQLY